MTSKSDQIDIREALCVAGDDYPEIMEAIEELDACIKKNLPALMAVRFRMQARIQALDQKLKEIQHIAEHAAKAKIDQGEPDENGET